MFCSAILLLLIISKPKVCDFIGTLLIFLRHLKRLIANCEFVMLQIVNSEVFSQPSVIIIELVVTAIKPLFKLLLKLADSNFWYSSNFILHFFQHSD